MTEPFNLDHDHDFDAALVGRYVTGTASPAERRAVESWIAADPARHDVIAQFEVLWREAGGLGGRAGTDDDVDVESYLQALHQRLEPGRLAVRPIQSAPRRRGRWVYAAAAAAVLAAGAGMLWKAGVMQSRPESSVPTAMREYSTPRGQRAQFRLPDGTQVMLSVASRLRVPLDYGVRDRRLYLTGAAYFDVQHDSTLRFFVHTGDVITEDLGTRFAVRAYETDASVQVAVREGRVAMRAPRGEALLGVGDLAVVAGTGEIVRPENESVERAFAWTKGWIEFYGTPLEEALPELSRWFDLDFRVGDRALNRRRLTGSFENRPDDWMLKELALTLGVRLQRDGRVVTLYQMTGAR